jgi:hypothetical protein
VRRFKPQVIVSIFRDGESPTHGQHQAAGVTAHAAFRTAADPDFDREGQAQAAGLEPWSPQALYRRAWWEGEEAPQIKLPLTGLRPLDGLSWRQMAAVSRSMHRSQDMGALQRLGDGETSVVWEAGGAGSGGDGLFAGVDMRLEALAASMADPSVRAEVESLLGVVAERAASLRRALAPLALSDAVAPLAEIHHTLAAAEALAGGGAAGELIAGKRRRLEEALLAAAGVVIDARAERSEVAPGQSIEVTLEVWNSGPHAVAVEAGSLTGAALRGADVPLAGLADGIRALARGELAAWVQPLALPADAPPTVPYFLRAPRQGDLYDWSSLAPGEWGAPFEAPPLVLALRLTVAGVEIALEREVVDVFADQARGEVRLPLRVVPRLEVEAAPGLVVRPMAAGGATRLAVRLRSHAEEGLAGTVEVAVPAGWPVPAAVPFAIVDAAGSAALEIDVALPPGVAPGHYALPVTARLADGASYDLALPVTDYPHVRPRPRPEPAAVDLVVVDLALPAGRIGWVVGASDVVPQALARLGMQIDLLAAAEVAEADLAAYDTVVIGSRAYETNEALGRANTKLLDFARAGGTLVVLYQQYQFSAGGFTPFPFAINRPHDRVTDETAAVRLLDPAHRAFREPNLLTAADWDGWVQERGLYFGGTWGPEFVPLLAMADPGEAEAQGGLLVAPLGRGLYVYTGLSFFRQIPAGVPGAYRLLANLLAMRGGA